MEKIVQGELVVASLLEFCQDIIKSDNLLNKQGFVKTQWLYTVTTVNESGEASSNSLELPLCIIG